MADIHENKAPEKETNTAPAAEAEINEVDGAPIFHAPEEEGDGEHE
jgi:hypothetical protein